MWARFYEWNSWMKLSPFTILGIEKLFKKNIQNFLLRSFMFVATYQFVVPLVMCCAFFLFIQLKNYLLIGVAFFFFNSFNIQRNKKKNYYQLIRNLYSQLLKWMSNIDPRNTKSTTNNSMSFSFSIFFLISCVYNVETIRFEYICN